MNDDPQTRSCPFCKAEVLYFSLPWTTITTRDGILLRRRMGPCPTCGIWLKPILFFPEEGEGGWFLEPVELYEVEQITIDDKTRRRHDMQNVGIQCTLAWPHWGLLPSVSPARGICRGS